MKWEQRFFESLSLDSIEVRREPYDRPVAQGRTMAYRLLPPGSPKARIVFAHATGNDALFPQVELFRRWLGAGYEIFTFDLDGHGRHSTTQLSPDTCQSMIQSAVKAARATHPHLTNFGAGQSLGAALWLRSLAEDPTLSSCLVVFSAPLWVDTTPPALAHEILALTSSSFWRQFFNYGLPRMIPPMGPWGRSSYPLRFKHRDHKAYPLEIAALIRSLRIEEVAPLIDNPALLISGTLDRIVNLMQAERLQKALRQAALLTIEHATHYTLPFTEEGITGSLGFFNAHS